MLHEPHCEMSEISPDLKNVSYYSQNAPPVSGYVQQVFPALPERGSTGGSSCQEKPLVVLQHPGTVVYVPPQWWHFTYNIDDTIGISVHTTIPRMPPPLQGTPQPVADAPLWLAEADVPTPGGLYKFVEGDGFAADVVVGDALGAGVMPGSVGEAVGASLGDADGV